MKKIILSIFAIFTASAAYSQVIIGTGKAAPTNASVSLEFGTEEKGIILPWVTSQGAVSGAVDGTLIYDTNDKKVKAMQAGSWFDLTLLTTGKVNTSLQDDPLKDFQTAKVSIGTPVKPEVPGILVLEDANKGMILPQVASYANISSPEPGMMVFDTTKKLLCFYNGTQWSFWQPE